jgi:GTP-binding protein
VQSKLFFLDYAPVIFTSAKSGFQLDRLLETVRYVAAQLRQRVPTAILNRTLNDAVERRQPISATGARLKFFYATQIKAAPPTFLLFVNRDELFSDTYTRHLAGEMRKAFGYEGCPIVLVPRARPKSIAPVRLRDGGAGRKSAENRLTAPAERRRKYRSHGGKTTLRSRLDKARGRGLTRKNRFRRK